MDKSKIDFYLMTNAKYFEPSAIPLLRKKLEQADEDTFLALQACDLKDPTILLLLSIFLGELGVDRFMIGDIGMGILKLMTFGLCGILYIVDIFLIMKRTKEKNFATISMFI